MTQNPYAQPHGFDNMAPVAARTSVAAILSLVCSLICCVPALSVLAVILGIAALVMIGGSNGRLSGKGLAIAGILIGLIVTVAHAVAFFVLPALYMEQTSNRAGRFFQAVEAKNYAQARTELNAPMAPTDEQLDAFVQAYQAEVGTFVSMPQGFFEMVGTFSNFQGSPNMAQAMQQTFPGVGEFSNGTAAVLLMPARSQPSGPASSDWPYENIGIHSTSGATIWLFPVTRQMPQLPHVTPPAPPPAPSTTPPTPSGNGG